MVIILAKKIKIDIIADDQASAVYKKVINNTTSMASTINNSLLTMNSALRKYNIAMWDFNRVATRVFTLAGNSVYKFTAESINNFTLLEQQHAKTMGAMANNYDKTAEAQKKFLGDQKALRDNAIKLGMLGPSVKVNGANQVLGSLYSPVEVSSAQTALVKAGKKPNEIIKSGVTDTILKFAGGNDMSIDDATQFAVNLGTQFQIPMDKWEGMLNMVTRAADQSVVDVEDIMESIKYAGGISSGLGRPLEEVLASIEVMGNAGLRGSMAGTGIQQFYTRILSPVGKSQAVLDKAPGIAGQVMEAFLAETTDENGKFRDMSTVTDLLDKSMNMLNDKEQAWFAQKLFGLFQMKAGYALGRPLADGTNAVEAAQNDLVSNSSGAIDKKYYYMMESQFGSIMAMKNAWIGIQTDFGSRMSPVINALADEVFAYLSQPGNYEINFDKLKTAVYETGGAISDQYGAQLGELVTNLGTMGIDASRILMAIAPTIAGGASASLSLLSGNPTDAWYDMRDALEQTKGNINNLDPELQELANNANSAAVALFALAGINIATKIIETISTLWKYTGGKIVSTLTNVKATKAEVDAAAVNAKATTMNVRASVVNVYGGTGGKSGSGTGVGTGGNGGSKPTPPLLPPGSSSAKTTGGWKGTAGRAGLAGLLMAGMFLMGGHAENEMAYYNGAGKYTTTPNGFKVLDSSSQTNQALDKYKTPKNYTKSLEEYMGKTKTFDGWKQGQRYLTGAADRYYSSRKAAGVPVSKEEYMQFSKDFAAQIRQVLNGKNPDGRYSDVTKLPSYSILTDYLNSRTNLTSMGDFQSNHNNQTKITLSPKVNVSVKVDKSGNVTTGTAIIPDVSWFSDWYYNQSVRNGK